MQKRNSLLMTNHTSVYLGSLSQSSPHQHGALVLLIGLSGNIHLRFQDGFCIDCKSALIDANVMHSFNPQGEQIASIYIEVTAPQSQLLRTLYLQKNSFAIDIVKPSASLYRNQHQLFNLDLDTLLGISYSSSSLIIDPRVKHCINLLKLPSNFAHNQSFIAEQVQLSRSRLNHLFKQVTGVPYSRYKLWSQLSWFMRSVKYSNNLTHAALESGFFDSSHLSNSYRNLLGISPSAFIRDLKHFDIK